MKPFITLIFVLGFSLSANLLLKLGTVNMGEGFSGYIERLFSWQVILGLSLFGLGGLCYVFLLKLLPLSIAQSFMALQFILIVVASRLIFGDVISNVQWLGIFLISTGIFLVGYGQFNS